MVLSIPVEILPPLYTLLRCETPQSWLDMAKQPKNLATLLIDHLICELKAAQTAVFLLRKYALVEDSTEPLLAWLAPYETLIYHADPSVLPKERNLAIISNLAMRSDVAYAPQLIEKFLPLIREELHHFYQVWEILQQRNIAYQTLSAGRYAKSLMRKVRTFEPATLVDKLICGALIEARSCERFAKLIPYLDEALGRFYLSLLRSEARHYQDYLALAEQVTSKLALQARIDMFAEYEKELILTPDDSFRFHSGVPQ